jgi:arsenate reductase (glutaredoxin)
MLNEHRIHLHVYGIRNCDTVRATLKWLDTRNVPYTFHNVRAEALTAEQLRDWLESAHGPYLVNRRSATWRKLDEAGKRAADADPVPLLLEHPTLLKRPVITDGEEILDVGFDPESLEDYI